ncbi:anthranilate phosphoribosyltransferase [Cryptosporangium phraense]|uniref:Anthranilate phosphoribosyltransferase n=1 Tax=Cryptosporangium phraense TaxID=2593070 RepID=A0A545ATC2_9ACTN|nr:anthranilate phosphoribosyltransferase [Cryptosporangium phraense]TQS44563.1 anthranilate phosphoribosyltransferase [Cryptosporangium phraense]
MTVSTGPAPTWPLLLNTLLAGETLTPEQTGWAMTQVMSGDATPVQIAAFAMALRAKGETPEEVTGLVSAMLEAATPIDVSPDAVDIVGTGGDQAHTVNISTMAAIVVAGAGIPVVKHGNRAASSSTGAADLLEYLGIPITMTPERAAACVREAGIAFCFAPTYHPGLRHAGVARREMGVPTFFNFLGPLTNPGRVRASAVGCANERMAPVMAGVFAQRGASALVMRGEDGLDEFTTTAPTRIWLVADGSVTETVVDAADLGIPRASREDLRGADAAFNAKVARAVFAGERGPVRDAVLVNAAAAVAAFDGFPGGLEASLRAGLERVAEAIDTGAAGAALDRWIAVATQD